MVTPGRCTVDNRIEFTKLNLQLNLTDVRHDGGKHHKGKKPMF